MSRLPATSASQYFAQQLLNRPPEERQQYARDLAYNQLSFAPVTGEAISAKEAKEFYDQGRYGMMALAGLGVLPVVPPLAQSAGSLLNKIAQNTPTHIPEFYSNPLKGMFNFGKEYTKAVPATIQESIDPQAVAKRRLEGISETKVADFFADFVGFPL